MEDTPGLTTTLTSVSKGFGTAGGYAVTSALDFYLPDFTSSCLPRGNKRKFTYVNQPINSRDRSSLVLELGLSPNSCTTGKEIEEESSLDLGLGINLCTGNSRLSNPKNVSGGTLNASKNPPSVVDLQLSLSTGPADSDLTCVTQESTSHHQKYPDTPALPHRFQLFDEGSTSSRWKIGYQVPPLQNTDILPPLSQKHGSGRPHPLNISSTDVERPSFVGSTSGLPNQQKRKSIAKICKIEGCTTGARGASGLCIAHGGGRRCQRVGCHKGAEGKTVFCKAHGGGRRCHHLGCTKSAEGRTDFCISHGGGRRCMHNGCTRASRGKSGLCIRHGGGKRCKIESCTRSAEGHSGLCISHGGGRRCQYPGCTKGAQGSTMLCKAHGGGRRCTFLGCTKGAEGSTLFCKGHGGGKRCTSQGCTKSVHGGTLFCVSHGGGKRCATPGCTKSARGRTNHCVRHGGGKRCKYEGCTKSAQGSTHFCKAHGGGRRCTWGQLCSEGIGALGSVPCDKFARGRSGLCVAHCTLVHEKSPLERSEMVSSSIQESGSSLFTQGTNSFAAGTSMSYPLTTGSYATTSVGYGHHLISLPTVSSNNLMFGTNAVDLFSLPEGRVHGGVLMEMLREGINPGTGNGK